ncbi:MAG: DUF1592 domain-containing protein [Verrucomicrobiales bacterium]
MRFGKIIFHVFCGAVIWGSGNRAVFADDFMSSYCLKCHGDDPQNLEGETDLRNFSAANRHDWLTLIDQIDSEEMPTKAPYPTRAQRDAVLTKLRHDFTQIEFPELESPTARRLTREEYANTLRDLLGVNLRAGENLPIDGQGTSGFSNDRAALAITPSQMELLFASAERALDGAFAIALDNRKTSSFSAQKMTTSAPGVKAHLDGMMVVQPTHFLEVEVEFPVDGFYEFSANAATIGQPCVAQFFVSGEVVAEIKFSKNDIKNPIEKSVSTFVRRGFHSVKIGSKNLVPHIPLPPDFVGKIDEQSRKSSANLPAPPDETPAARKLRESLNLKALGMQESIEYLTAFGVDGDSREIDQRRKYYHEREADWDRILAQLASESEFSRKELAVAWWAKNQDRLQKNQEILDRVAHVEWKGWMAYQGKLYVEAFAVSGPVLPESDIVPQKWNLIRRMREPVDPTALVREFAEQAFRRPVSETELAPYVRVVLEAQRREEDRARSVKLALAAILMSSDFLFRGDEPENWRRASDLSYFLWLSKPDLELAEADLRIPDVLKSQIARMLTDPRSDAFFSRFSDEWLELEEIAPDRNLWPDFTPDIADSMRQEVHAFIAKLLRENRPVSDLLTADESFADQNLSAFYGMTDLENSNRFGLLGKGAVLVATSSPTRTNPVRRGKWVWENLLGLPVGDPLPDAGELPGDAGEARGKTLREELAEHSTKTECARCHEKIDPIGFGLENFDATGRWRTLEAGKPVNATGQLHGGGEFSGPIELRELLIETRGNELAQNVALRLRALYRGIENEPGYRFKNLTSSTGLREVLETVLLEPLER